MTTITPQRLHSLFRPRSVALVGASDKSAFSNLVHGNLVQFGFGEHVHLVDRRGAETHGRPTVTSCQEIGAPVDVAFMMVPQAGMLEALSDAAAAGIGNAVVLSSGDGEAGEAGRTAEAALVAHARSLDMVVLGPNMLGFANFVDRIPVTSIPGLPQEHGPVALLSQSGASSSAMLDFATMVGVGMSYMVTVGNEAMITVGHILDYLVDDEHTNSGGACDIVADRAQDLGAPLPALAPETETALAEITPAYGTVQNPLDVTGAAVIDPTIFTRTIAAVSNDPSIGVVAVVNALPWLPSDGPYIGQVFVNAIGAGMQQAATPCAYVNQVLQPVTETTRASMEAGGVPYTIPGLRQMVVALRNVGWWSETTRTAATTQPRGGQQLPVPAPSARKGVWSEDAARRLLADAGVPVVPAVLARSAEEAAKAAADFGGPVVLKICSPQILHKSDIGGVRLGVSGDDVRAAYQALAASAATIDGAELEGVLVSPMRPGGIELLVGVVRDPQWGPMLAVALGGIFVEVLNDSALSPLPVPPAKARQLLTGLRAAAVFDGVRGAAPADLDAVVTWRNPEPTSRGATR